VTPAAPPPATAPAPTTAPTTVTTNTPVDTSVDHTRAWTGLWVVVAGDVAIALAAILGMLKVSTSGGNAAAMVSILTSAFTAIGTMTTAYFGIRAVSNTAQHSIANPGSTTVTPGAAAPTVAPVAPVGGGADDPAATGG
jgi:hypothetical protein